MAPEIMILGMRALHPHRTMAADVLSFVLMVAPRTEFRMVILPEPLVVDWSQEVGTR